MQNIKQKTHVPVFCSFLKNMSAYCDEKCPRLVLLYTILLKNSLKLRPFYKKYNFAAKSSYLHETGIIGKNASQRYT